MTRRFSALLALALLSSCADSLRGEPVQEVLTEAQLRLRGFTAWELCLLFAPETSCPMSASSLISRPPGGHTAVNLSGHSECLIDQDATKGLAVTGGSDVCRVRSAADRSGLRSEWSGVPLLSSSVAADLANFLILKSRNASVTNLVFIGDSVTAQFASFFTCSLIRAGIDMVSKDTPIRYEHMRKKIHTYSEFRLVGGQDRALRVHSVRIELPCEGDSADERCRGGPEMQRRLGYDLSAGLLQSATAEGMAALSCTGSGECLSHRNFVVFNVGLHATLQSLRVRLDPVLNAFIDTASNSSWSTNTTFVFRESTSQAFASTADGSYDVSKHVLDPNQLCCAKPLIPQSNWRDEHSRHVLQARAPDWTERIGWVPFFDWSARLHDAHVEFRAKQAAVDCTHFTYSPLTYDILWWEILRTYRNMLS